MKKIVSLMCVIFAGILLVGCGNSQKQAVDTINNHIIEKRNNIFAGSDDNFFATFCSGDREDPYSLDGEINGMVDFGIVTFSKKDNSKLVNDEYLFTVIINGESKGGTLTKSPYDNTYSADIGMKVDDNAEIKLCVEVNGTAFDQILYNESKNFIISQNEAIEKAGEELKSSIAEMTDKDGKTAEAMIKILKDFSGETNRYFWYVGIISVEGKTAGVLIDTQTGEIVSKKL